MAERSSFAKASEDMGGFDEEQSDEERSAKLDARGRFCDEVPEREARRQPAEKITRSAPARAD